jgi:hypothetical protein
MGLLSIRHKLPFLTFKGFLLQSSIPLLAKTSWEIETTYNIIKIKTQSESGSSFDYLIHSFFYVHVFYYEVLT